MNESPEKNQSHSDWLLQNTVDWQVQIEKKLMNNFFISSSHLWEQVLLKGMKPTDEALGTKISREEH